MRALVFLTIVMLLAGCSIGGGSASVGADELENTVLQQEDVPGAFFSFDEGPLQTADGKRGKTGWKARYRRTGSPSTRGPLVIESRVDRFEDGEAAEESLEAVVSEARAGDWADAGSTEIGAEGYAFSQVADAVTPVQYFMVVWRQANLVASVTASGFAEKVTLKEVVALAQAQQRRADAATG